MIIHLKKFAKIYDLRYAKFMPMDKKECLVLFYGHKLAIF